MASRVQLAALGAGSGKNNSFGIGARIDLRVGDIQQTRMVTDRTTHFGLGPHLKADVVRIAWKGSDDVEDLHLSASGAASNFIGLQIP